jgi:hypothetical protein
MEEKDVTRWAEWDDPDHLPLNTLRLKSVGLAADEERDQRAELFQRFSKNVLGESSSDSHKKRWNAAQVKRATLPPSSHQWLGGRRPHALQ